MTSELTESQLRDLLGDRFESLTRVGGEFRCAITVNGATRTFDHGDAAEAYGLALLELLGAG